MRKLALIILAIAGAVVLAALTRDARPQAVEASSHREAPLISEDPAADNTDLYAFRSPDKPNTLTVISNWIPGEDPAAGPNYYTFSPRARYNIKIDRTGDGKPEIVYRFRFKTKPGQLFLGNTEQHYTVEKIAGGRSRIIARGQTPPNNIGPRTLKGKDYRQIAASRVTGLPGGGKVFAGQRDDAFYADVGAIFDLLAIRKGTGNEGGGKDFLAGYAVHAIALQLPISKLDTKSHVIGIWATTDRQQVKVRNGHARMRWSQVSRLGNPLVNEVVIPTALKDLWNHWTPSRDKYFQRWYRTPILAKVMNQLYHLGVPEKNRKDLVAVLLTGVPNLNFTSPRLAELLRLNLTIPVTKNPNRMAVLAGDNQGWPNGRRLGDDVIDIAEQAVGGFLKGTKLPLGDGVNADDRQLLGSFPYIADPQSGFDNTKGK